MQPPDSGRWVRIFAPKKIGKVAYSQYCTSTSVPVLDPVRLYILWAREAKYLEIYVPREVSLSIWLCLRTLCTRCTFNLSTTQYNLTRLCLGSFGHKNAAAATHEDGGGHGHTTQRL